MTIRREVMRFANQMEIKLRKNDHKAGWENCKPSWLLRRLQAETNEIKKALCNRKNVWGECADVGNFAMMIADNFRRKSKRER